MASGIYRIDLGSGWFYIGSTANLKTRKAAHLWELRKQCHRSPKVQSIWNKYGEFEFNVLELCSVDELLQKEQRLLDSHFTNPKNANLMPVAGSPMKGRKHTPEAILNMSIAAKNSPAAIAHRVVLHQKLWNRPCSVATRQLMSAKKKGTIQTAEHVAKRMSAGKRTRELNKANA